MPQEPARRFERAFPELLAARGIVPGVSARELRALKPSARAEPYTGYVDSVEGGWIAYRISGSVNDDQIVPDENRIHRIELTLIFDSVGAMQRRARQAIAAMRREGEELRPVRDVVSTYFDVIRHTCWFSRMDVLTLSTWQPRGRADSARRIEDRPALRFTIRAGSPLDALYFALGGQWAQRACRS